MSQAQIILQVFVCYNKNITRNKKYFLLLSDIHSDLKHLVIFVICYKERHLINFKLNTFIVYQ